jgi:phosphohistidine swiveling domain-containing protein
MKSKTLWTKTLSEEFWSGVVSPLMFSIAGDLIEERMARKGIELAGLKSLQTEKFFRLFGGQVYLNSHILEEVVKLIPSVLLTPEMLRFFPREIQEDFTEVRVSFFSPHTLRILFRLFGMDKDWAPFFNYKAFDRTVARLEQVRRTEFPVDEQTLTTPELLERSRMLCREMGDFLDVVTWGMVFAYVFHPLTEILARKWGQDDTGELAAALTVGLEGIKTFEINREIEALAESVDDDPFLRRIFKRARGKTILKNLHKNPEGEAFCRQFSAFLDQHGHRFHGRDILFSTWRECPEMLIDMIKMNRGSDRSRKTFAQQQEKRKRAETILRSRIRKGALGASKIALFSQSLLYNQKYFTIRENMRYHSDIFLEQFRRLYLEIGSRWMAEGVLKKADDVAYLSKEEIERACTQGENPRKTVEERKREYHRYRFLRTPEVITDDTRLQPTSRVPEEETFILSGEAASPGFVSGPARVVRDPRDILAFHKGEILVAEYTDPSWTPVLSGAAGIVIESGGFLSHGSIVAREYGIPALIQVAGAVERIRNGDRLELDTDTKIVRIERD